MAAARRWLAMTRLLWDALGDVPDRRGRQGRQYELRSVLGIALAAMLAGANDLRAIWRWGRRLRPEALRLFGIESGRSPCHASYHYFFQALDADALAATLGRYARGEATGGHIALDGKTLRGSRRLDAAPLHVLSAFATELAAVIGDLVVPPEANEITAALTLLKGLPLEGAIVTGDAIFAQREICRHVRDDRREDEPAGAASRHRHRLRRRFPPVRSLRPMSPGPRRWRRATAASRPARSRSAARSSPIWPGRASPRWPASSAGARSPARPAPRSSTSSPACRPRRPLRSACCASPGTIGASRTGSTTSATSPSPRIDAASAPVPAPLAPLRNFAITLIRRAGLSISEARENFREDRANAITLV